MNYTKPLILKSEKAVSVIQQVNQQGQLGKNPKDQVDLDGFACTIGAYEADE